MKGKSKIPAEFLQKIKDAVNILDVVGEHVVLRKTGGNSVGLCPFHSERSPSFSVHENKGLYHCYGCKKSGDLFTFAMEIHGITFPEAVEELAERARLPLPLDWNGGLASDDPEVQKKRRDQRENQHILFKLNLFAMAFFRQQLKAQVEVMRYFKSRGVNDDLALNFRVGAVPPAWDALARHMADKKAPLAKAVELGLIRPSSKNSRASSMGYFDLFRNRAMFPIIDLRGRVAGFGGRTLPEHVTRAMGGSVESGEMAPPKYMNSPESPVFQKSKLAFGLFQAQKHVRETDELILVEGYFDVLALHAAGFENVVATCGTSLTPEHLRLFQRFAKKITVLFDGDSAGVSATERAMEVGLEQGLVLSGASLPRNLDPDELLFDQSTGQSLPQGREQMSALLSGSRPLLATRLAEECAKARGGPEARTQALRCVAGWLGKYKDPVGRQIWVEEAAKGLGVTPGLLYQAMGVHAGAQPTSFEAHQNRRPQGLPRGSQRPTVERQKALTTAERVLLQGLAIGGDYSVLLQQARGKLPKDCTLVELFVFEPARDWVSRLIHEPGAFELMRASPEKILTQDIDPSLRPVLTEAWVTKEPLFTQAEFKNALDRALSRNWARFSQQIKKALAEAEAKQDGDLHAQLMKDYLDVQRKIKEFNNFYDEA